MDFTKIDIDVEVHKAMEARRASFQQTPNDILREVFGLGKAKPAQAPPAEKPNKYWAPKGVPFAPGTVLQAHYRGRTMEGTVEAGGLRVRNKLFATPSAAACAVTNNNVNGWRFWKYFDEQRDKWRYITELRD